MLNSIGILRIFIFIPITCDTSIRGKVKNNEDSRNMHILKIIPTMHNVYISLARKIRSSEKLNHTLNSFLYHFLTNCIHEKIIYSTLLFILFISSSFKLYLLISKYQYGTSFERINSRGEKKKKKLIIWAQELTSFNTKIILLNYRELTKPLIYGWGTAKIEFEFSVFRLYFEMLPHLFNT